MKRITFVVGIGTRNGKELAMKPILEIREATQQMASIFGGFTAIEGNGGWFDSDTNRVVYEPSLTLIVYSEQLFNVESSAVYLRDLFGQTCVLVTIENLEGFKYV